MLRAGSDGNACVWGRGGLIYLFVAYSGGVLMFIHRFRRGLVRQNSCNHYLYRNHMQPSNAWKSLGATVRFTIAPNNL